MAGVQNAQVVGVFSRRMKLRSCTYHAFNLKLGDSDYFGSKSIPPLVFDRILATFYSIIRHCETRREAMITVQCLRAYGRRTLVPTKFEKLDEFINKAIASLPAWALFVVVYHLMMGEITTSGTEGGHSVTKRSTRGRWGLDASSDPHAILEKGRDSNTTRQIEREIKAYNRISSSSLVPSENTVLNLADQILHTAAFADLVIRFEKASRRS